MAHIPGSQTDAGDGVTRALCGWIHRLCLNDIPEEIRVRAKYLILDGIACAIVGAHLPWTETAAKAIFSMESPGNCAVWGWEKVYFTYPNESRNEFSQNANWTKKIGPLPAALLNSTSVQSFEIDDFHSLAPLHSNAILLPALFAAASQQKAITGATTDGNRFLLSTIVGYETGPRVGLALYGADMLSRGWHSGTVFGHAASAAASSKLLDLPENIVEDALGIACTQACGLMSAQFGSDVKRMQHGFASRNGLFAALMAKEGYVGIKSVFEQPYGGFLAVFGAGSGKEPPHKTEEITKELGQTWQLQSIRVKAHASMGGTHCTIDCIRELQKKYPEQMSEIQKISNIKAEMSEAAFKHGGWNVTRPLTATGAQMSCAYVAAVQLVDSQVTPSKFHHDLLDRDVLWELIRKTECLHTPELGEAYQQRVTITFKDHSVLTETLDAPIGFDPPLTNDAILEKWRQVTKGLIPSERRDEIERLVLDLENLGDVTQLEDLLLGPTLNPIS
jgi:aconitate decarboxylase